MSKDRGIHTVDLMSVIDDTKSKMNAIIDHLKQDLKSLRTGRSNPALLDGVEVEIYGTKMRLKNAANITAPDARSLMVTPFDPSNIGVISKAIEKANLNLQPVADKAFIRIAIPPMDQSARQERVKQARKKGEEARVAVRNIRRDSNESIKKMKSAGDMAEDEMKKREKQIQELTDKYCKEVDDLITAKEKDILEI